MKKNLLDQTQPFGMVLEHGPMGGQGAPHAMSSKPCGAETKVTCHGMDHGPSFGDKNPGARAAADRYMHNPEAWCGYPEKMKAKHVSVYTTGE